VEFHLAVGLAGTAHHFPPRVVQARK
jgi:hypothetical protein